MTAIFVRWMICSGVPAGGVHQREFAPIGHQQPLERPLQTRSLGPGSNLSKW